MPRLQFTGKAINQYRTKNGTIMRTYALAGKTADLEAYKALMCAKTNKTEWPCDDTSKLPLYFMNVSLQKESGNYHGGTIKVIQSFTNEDQFFADNSANEIELDGEMSSLIRLEEAKLQARINKGLERPVRRGAALPVVVNNPTPGTSNEPKPELVKNEIEDNNGEEVVIVDEAGEGLNNG